MEDEIKLDQTKVQGMVKQFDEQYGETVLSPDDYKSPEERQAILKHNENAKLKHADRRENEHIQASIERDEKIKKNFKKATDNIKKGTHNFIKVVQRLFGTKQK